jgi:ATP-binding cassette, subfamily B, bacterial
MSMHGAGVSTRTRAGLRGLQRDRKILEHRIKKGTLPRILRFARAYRPYLIVFLIAVVLDAVVSSISPLLLRAIIDNGIIDKHRAVIIDLSVLTAVLAVFDAGLVLTERRISAVIGEGLIYDLRAKVFEHIQQMPIAFFSRTQTGALISRLNNDVIGAQQAFTDLFSNVVGNVILVTIVLGTMFVLSWQITLVALVPPAGLPGAGPHRGPAPGHALPARHGAQRRDEHGDERALQRGRRDDGQALRPPREERQYFEVRAGQVRDIGIDQATLPALLPRHPVAHRLAGHGLRLRLRRGRSPGRRLRRRHGGGADGLLRGRLYGPLTQLSNLNIDYMSAMVSFERLFEVLDLEPMIKESPDAVGVPDGPAHLEFEPRRLFLPRGRGGLARVARGGGPLDDTPRTEVLHDISPSR